MRGAPLTVIKGAIDRERPKGGARADTLYDLLNARVTREFNVVPREGTVRIADLPPGTVGLVAFDGSFYVFASAPVDVETTIAAITIGSSGGTLFGFSPPTSFNFGASAPAPPFIGGVASIYVNTATTPDRLYFMGTDSGVVLAALQAYPTIRVEYAGGVVDFDTTNLVTPDPSSAAFTATDYPIITTMWAAADVGDTYNVSFVSPSSGELPGYPEFTLAILLHPTNPDAVVTEIHFAEPFMGALYVVAEFDDGSIHHYWLQQPTGGTNEDGSWTADTEYSMNQFVEPTTPNGFVYRAGRLGSGYPAWTPGALRTVGEFGEPTVYNEYYYEVIATTGDNPRSGAIEPEWPLATGATVVESTDGILPPTTPDPTPPTPPAPTTPQASGTRDRYQRNLPISGGLR